MKTQIHRGGAGKCAPPLTRILRYDRKPKSTHCPAILSFGASSDRRRHRVVAVKVKLNRYYRQLPTLLPSPELTTTKLKAIIGGFIPIEPQLVLAAAGRPPIRRLFFFGNVTLKSLNVSLCALLPLPHVPSHIDQHSQVTLGRNGAHVHRAGRTRRFMGVHF